MVDMDKVTGIVYIVKGYSGYLDIETILAVFDTEDKAKQYISDFTPSEGQDDCEWDCFKTECWQVH